MPKATLIVRRAAVRPDQIVDTIVLDHAARRIAHAHLTTAAGLAVDLDLARAAALEDGDALKLDDGRLVGVSAAQEALLAVHAANPARLMRLAWQLGGSHVPAEIEGDRLYVPASAAELVRGSGCTAEPVTRAFRPERDAHDHGACGHDHGVHGHDGHGHEHGRHHATHSHDHHDHGHAHDHDHAREPAARDREHAHHEVHEHRGG